MPRALAAAVLAVAATGLAGACGGGTGAVGEAGEVPTAADDGPAVPVREAPRVVTEVDSGSRCELRAGAPVTLRLTSEIDWRSPEVHGPLELVQVDYLQDPGYREWEVQALGAGEAVVRAECDDGEEPFEVVFEVEG